MFKEREILTSLQPFLYSPEAVFITGMRRTGKTSILKYLYTKFDTKNKLFLDLENPINRKYFESDNYEKIKSSLEILGLDFTTPKIAIFLDEIQYFQTLPSIVKYFIDTYRVKFFLTGSIHYYSQKLFDESLAGRKVVFDLFPLTFREFLRFKGKKLNPPINNNGGISKAIFDVLSTMYEEYILFGGFPEVVLKKTIEEKNRILDDIFASFFKFEVVQLSSYRKSEVIRDLMLLLMKRTCHRLDIQKISHELGISRATTYEYLRFLEDSYFIRIVRPYLSENSLEIRKSARVYICDSGLVNQFTRVPEEYLFQNSVFQNLQTKGTLQYYERKSGAGIHFILNEKQAFQVTLHPNKSDLSRLKRLASELELTEFALVSKHYSELEAVEYAFMV
ncbi:MAG TPA: ATP-binding protein [Caldisericia bacterium]|nr:ATP-binding protein [Caldisericia bacterium]